MDYPWQVHDTNSLDNATAYIINHTARILHFNLQKFVDKAEANITIEQWFILFRLYEKPGQSQRDLANKYLNDHPNITRMLDALEKRELVKRTQDSQDRRRFLIFLTEAGQVLMDRMIPLAIEERKRIFAGISQAEVDALVATLKKIERNVTGD